jgi:hypothetical protein
MSDDLVKQLRNRADRWMKYGYEEHAKTDTEAADRIEKLELIVWQLEAELDDATEELMELRGDK